MIYDLAKQLSEDFKSRLSPACLRIETVGSTKRADRKSLAEGVHDIEFLIIPKPGIPVAEFGRPKNIYLTHLDKLLADLEYQDIIRQASDKKDGPRYKKRAILNTGELNEFCMDLFIVTPTTWGLQNLIRTGPGWFSHRCVTNQNVKAIEYDERHIPTGKTARGFLPNNLRYLKAKDSPDKLSHIMRGDEVLSLPEERDVFNLIFGKWIPPAERRDYAESK